MIALRFRPRMFMCPVVAHLLVIKKTGDIHGHLRGVRRIRSASTC